MSYNIIINIFTFLHSMRQKGCDVMGFPKVERLLINYKTLDEFKNLKAAELKNYPC